MKIALGCDHGGYELKEFIITVLNKLGYEHEDFGCYSTPPGPWRRASVTGAL